jgi:hypothetical protein
LVVTFRAGLRIPLLDQAREVGQSVGVVVLLLDELQIAPARFACSGCKKQYRWKPNLAGRRVKCGKCLTVMIAPDFPPDEAGEMELYDLVPDSPPPRRLQEYQVDPDLLPPPAPAAHPVSPSPAARQRGAHRVLLSAMLIAIGSLIVAGVVYRFVVA